MVFCLLIFSLQNAAGQDIVYSQIEKADTKNLNFEILGKFSNNFLVYKNLNRKHKLTIYDYDMVVKETIKLDFITDKTSNIDFVTYPNYFILVWQYQKGNTFYCNAAKMDATGKLIGDVKELDISKAGFFSSTINYQFAWSENKSKLLLTKTQKKNDELELTTKILNENLQLLDSSKNMLEHNNFRENIGDLQIDNEGTFVFYKTKENARQEYINSITINFKKINIDTLFKVEIPLEKQLVQTPAIKIDNLNKRYLINSFSYKKNMGYIDGMLTAVINSSPFVFEKKVINIFDDSLVLKMSGSPDWRNAYSNFFLRNIILKKDGGFVTVAEEYYTQVRNNNFGNDRNSGLYNNTSDYYLYNRGNYGYYRPYSSDVSREIVYFYNDILTISFTSDLKLQWNNVINKKTTDVETDNFLSFANMNAGSEIHFLFLQKDNNRQILSNHALQANGNITRLPTLKSRESGYDFMPKLARQTGAKQIIIPCIVRNNIAFAKIDF
ncbi:MAG: hypothetical protein HOO89_10285 [Ferruginibacter sp.]|nr:hypothetical protein [Ferruginibacter sp.]